MPTYDGQNGTTRRPRGGGRQADLLMQQLGTSTPSDDEPSQSRQSASGFDGNSTTSSAPLTFDASTDTRVGNPRRRRGTGTRLGNGAAQQQQQQSRPHAAGMIRNDEEVARRQQIIQGVAEESAPRRQSDGFAMRGAPSGGVMPASAVRPTQPGAPVQSGVQSAPSSISLNGGGQAQEEEGGFLQSNPLTDKIRQMRNRKFINPFTFIRDNGGGIETFGIWLYEYRHIFILLAIVFIIIGMLFDRRVSFAAGIAMILVGIWLDRIDDENDTFLAYLCGMVTAILPWIVSS